MDTSYEGADAPTAEYRDQVERIITASKGSVVRWITMPNHRSRWLSAPRGACVVMDGTKTVCSDVFCTDLFHGTAVLPVRFEERGWTPAKRASAMGRLGMLLPETPLASSEKSQWCESLGTNSCSAGLYSCRSRSSVTGRYESQWYLAVSAGLDETSAEALEDHLYDLEQQGITADAAFSSDALVQNARIHARRNRNRLLARTAAALGIDVQTRPDGTYEVPNYDQAKHPLTAETLSAAALEVDRYNLNGSTLPFWTVLPKSGFPLGPCVYFMLHNPEHPMRGAVLNQVKSLNLKFNPSALVCAPTIETMHHDVRRVDNELIYYNDCTNAANGVVYSNGPTQGLSVMRSSGTNRLTTGWTNDTHNAFPVCNALAGRGLTTPSLPKHVHPSNEAAYGTVGGLSNCAYYHSVYELAGAEEHSKLGFHGGVETDTLEPFIVWMSSTV